ncbi:MAG: glycosyltransferase family 2 protein [Deltaproteobacteria bacterium]|nr:glycosyltransferase family 2 protein [Deltaproteobacteria bacterium]
MKRVLAVLQLRNEELYLQGCLDHLRGFVDGVVAIDDGSEDRTAEILAADSSVISVITKPRSVGEHQWDEVGNKRALLERAKELGADWVLATDADERLERKFLVELRAVVGELPDVKAAIWCRELWDRPDSYRVDGVWGSPNKLRVRLFPMPPELTFDNNVQLHGPWAPDLVQKMPLRKLDYNFYHLKMIRRADRIARRDFYNRLDPEKKFQKIGYDYLADETGVVLERIPAGREYDYETLPPELRALHE